MATEPNLVKYLPRLSIKEKAVLLRLLREVRGEEHHFEGTLPFVAVSKAVRVLESVAKVDSFITDRWKAYSRIAKEILVKLSEARDDRKGKAVFHMRLNDKKVYRHFGKNPEKGKPLSFLPKEKVTVGVKYSLPKKDYVPDKDVLVAPCVRLKPMVKGPILERVWEITVLERCRPAVELWLMQNCR
jgi:hypothetical protein